jgi:hypothetical protein
MHIIETFAVNCGAKIDKPQIYTTFFPLPISKYITFHSDEAEPAKNYDYWQDVINMISPFLKQREISIIQIGDRNNRHFSECIDLLGQATANQWAYIIQGSLLHFGADGFLTHLASSFDTPLVSIYGIAHANCVKPYFGSPKKQANIIAYGRDGKKPSFSADENPKVINSIKPEEIANAILKLLGINVEMPMETVFVGKKYSSFVIEESIPNDPKIMFNPEHQVEIRADLGFDDNAFLQQVGNYKKSVVVVEKDVNITTLERFRQQINMIVVRVVDDTQGTLIKRLVEIGRPLVLVSALPESRIQELKAVYYEFGNINRLDIVDEAKINELKLDLDRLYYRSTKIVSNGGKYFYSHAASLAGVPMTNHHEYQKVIDSPEFWENLSCFTIVRKKPLTSSEKDVILTP